MESNTSTKADLEVININKKFGTNQVLTSVNLQFQRGNMYSLLGHNGAGKSTFVNILTGIYTPTSGNILWKGKDFRQFKRDSSLKELNLGICPSFECLQENMTVFQHLKVIGMIKEVSDLEKVIVDMMEDLKLTQYRDFKTKELSGGNKRKLSLAISLMGEPSLLFLDEPTSSIDPESRQEIWDILLRFKER